VILQAFSAMRARGARVTDIVIIIVAADDGVRPQTLEAISHAKAAGVPIVVAINKMDKEGANPDRVKQELTEVELVPEEWGGKTPMVNISAKKGMGVDELLETVLLVAELEELVANPDRAGTGTVLEACLDRKSGPITTLIVQNGKLKVGDCIAAGASYGKVRSLKTSAGEVSEIGPSMAAQVMGLNSVPQAGDEFEVFESETRARQAAESIEDARRLERLSEMAGGGSMVTLSSLASMDDETEDQVLQRMNIILKADASGSCEAVKAALAGLPQDTVMLRYLLSAPGDITASDIDLAVASGGTVLGFNVQPSEAVVAEAKKNNVELRTYSVIYDLVDDVRAAMEGRLKSVEEKVKIGEAEVKAVFGSGSRKAAGCLVLDGLLSKNAVVVVRRKKKVLFEGKLSSLRRVKDDVKEVPSGTECGVAVDGFKDWAEGDVIEAYDLVEKRLKLEEAHAPSISATAGAE
jgi:translation initiation factor IF-2